MKMLPGCAGEAGVSNRSMGVGGWMMEICCKESGRASATAHMW